LSVLLVKPSAESDSQ